MPDYTRALGAHLRCACPDGWFIPSAFCAAHAVPVACTHSEEITQQHSACILWLPSGQAEDVANSPLLRPWANVALIRPSTDGEHEQRVWAAGVEWVKAQKASHAFEREWSHGTLVVIQHKAAGYPRAGTILIACSPQMRESPGANLGVEAGPVRRQRQTLGEALSEVEAEARRAVMDEEEGEDTGAALVDGSEITDVEAAYNKHDGVVSRRNFVESKFRGTPSRIYGAMLWLQHQYPTMFLAPISCHSSAHLMKYLPDFRRVLWHPDLLRNLNMKPPGAATLPRFSAWVLVAHRPGDAHANLMLYDRLDRTVVRFEPRGWHGGYDSEPMDDALALSIRKHLGSRFIRPSEFQARIGPQRLEYQQTDKDKERIAILGPCAYWCLLFLHAKLRSPHLTYRDIDRLLRNIPASLTASIEAYGHVLSRVQLYLPPCPIFKPKNDSYHT